LIAGYNKYKDTEEKKKEIFPGENILLSQPGSKWDHYYYKLSTGEIINNYNDGKYLYLTLK